MLDPAHGRWRRLGAVVVSAALAIGLGSTLLAQSPPAEPGAMPPARTSTLFQPAPTATPVASAAPVASPSSQGMVAVVIPSDGLNLREAPDRMSASLAVLPVGTQVPVVGGIVNGAWVPVVYEGKNGFVSAEFVEIRPAGASASSPSARPVATPPAPTPAPTPPPRPALSPSSALFDNGVLLQGVYAFDIDDAITIADEFKIIAVVRPPEGATSVTLRLSGAPFLRASQTFDVVPGDNWLEVPSFRVDTENEPSLREEIVRKVGGTVPIRAGALVMAVDVTDGSGGQRTATFEPAVFEFARPTQVAKIEYPDLKRATGLPPNGAGVDNYYLRGDLDFHHPEDYFVRKLAVEAGRRGGVFADDPEVVADNVFTFINTLLGDAEPGDFNNDYNVARLVDEGTIKRGQLNGGYICIGQTYLMSSLTRTLGMPSRELNILVGRANFQGNDGIWRVTWWQEGAIHTWYNGRWNHYDLWLGFKGMNGYFEKNLAYQAWAAYDRRAVMFTTAGGAPTGLRGHDFGPTGMEGFEFVREASKPGYAVMDIPPENGDPVSGLGFGAYISPDGYSLPIGRHSVIPWPDAATGILNMPETRP